MAKGRAYYQRLARQAAMAAGIDPRLFVRQIAAESGFNPTAGSPAGAQGIAQIMPATARGWGVNPLDPEAALTAAARAMRKYVDSYGSYRNALVAYNAGPGRVGKPLYAETANYITRILGGSDPKGTTRRTRMTTPTASSGRAEALRFIFQDQPGFLDAISVEASTPRSPDAPPLPRVSGTGLGFALKLAERYGLPVTSTTGGKHAPGSYHYQKRAADLGLGAGGKRLELYARQHPRQFAEFYGPMNWHIENGRIQQGAYPDHSDHYHVAR